MGKYVTVAINSVKINLAYRVNNFMMLFSVFFSFMIMFYFWSSIYIQGNKIGSYTLNEILSYYVFVTIYELTIGADSTAWTIGEAIKSGQITNHILKPMKYLHYKIAQSLGGLLYKISLYGISVAVAIFILKNYIVFPSSMHTYFAFLLSGMLAYMLYFLIYFSIGILGFWFGNPNSLFFSSYLVISFMQGQWIPLDLLPGWFLNATNYLPFQYLLYVPVGIINGRIEFGLIHFLVPLIWCLVLYVAANMLYSKGIKKYEGYGI